MEFWVLVTICCLVCATIYGGRRVSLKPPNKTRYLDELSNSINGFSDDCGSMEIGIKQCQLLRFECLRVVQRPRRDSFEKESFCAIRRAKKLMQDCCCENWILKAAEFGNCQRHFLEILHDLHTLPIIVDQIRDESLDDMPMELRSIDISEETKSKMGRACKLDTAALRRKLVRDHWLADQLRAGAKPSLTAPDDIGRCVTKYKMLSSPPTIHKDANNGICIFPVTLCNKEFVIKARFSKPGAGEQEEIILRKEASFMKKCRHPYAVALLGYWEFIRTEGLCELTSVPLLLMEAMECDLDSIIKGNKSWWRWWGGTGGFPALDAINLVLPVAKVMKYLHEIGVVHLDLKPKNILYTRVPGTQDRPEDVSVKLADFGDAQKVRVGVRGRVGTNGYMDPGMYRWRQEGSVNLVKADVFSFGMAVGEVLTGLSPMEALGCKGKPIEFYKKLQEGKQIPLPKGTPDCVKSIVESCWNPRPNERPSFARICDELQKAEMRLLSDCTCAHS